MSSDGRSGPPVHTWTLRKPLELHQLLVRVSSQHSLQAVDQEMMEKITLLFATEYHSSLEHTKEIPFRRLDHKQLHQFKGE